MVIRLFGTVEEASHRTLHSWFPFAHLSDNGSGARELDGQQTFWVHIVNSLNHAAVIYTDIKLFLISE